MNIKEKFIQLTSRTYPHGSEDDVFSILNPELQKDKHGNYFIKIGDSDVMFAAHLDTSSSTLTDVIHVIDGDIIKTDGKSILGADDKAGVVIMLYMIEHNIPGLYYFFVGEEVGCVGSKKVASDYKTEGIKNINKVVSFDRSKYDCVITFQRKRTCSDKFAQALADQLNSIESTFSYKTDPTGVSTDSLQFSEICSECTNISVGYEREHTYTESQDIAFLEKLANACLKVDWASLPVERDPSKYEYRPYSYGKHTPSYGYGAYGWHDYDDYDDRTYSSSAWNSTWNNNTWNNSRTLPKPKTVEKIWFDDKHYNFVSNVDIDLTTRKITAIDIHKNRVFDEQLLIYDLLDSLEMSHYYIEWDGFKLKVFYKDGTHSECDRNDLIEYLPELDLKSIDEDFVIEEETSGVVDATDYTGFCDDLED